MSLHCVPVFSFRAPLHCLKASLDTVLVWFDQHTHSYDIDSERPYCLLDVSRWQKRMIVVRHQSVIPA